MQYIDFNRPCRVHFTGIGGISMSGLAELLCRKGFTVSGSDPKKSAITERLEELGIRIYYGQRSSNVTDDIAVLVYTAAVKPDNPELAEAAALGIPCIERASLVGDIMLHYERNFAVAGTHGKTTVTSMLSLIFLEAELDPTIQVGAVLNAIGSNIRIGGNKNMVIEACEYTDSFLKFHPTHAIITNIEAEHLDYFRNLERERDSFRRFAGLLPSDGLLVCNTSIPDYTELFKDNACRIVTYNFDSEASAGASPDYFASEVEYDSFGCASYTLCRNENGSASAVGRIRLNVTGRHNVTNSVGAAAMSLETGISFDTVAAALEKFTGACRRFEKKGEIAGVTIIDDYAHHPTEIKATLDAAAGYPHKTLWCVFQPHTYSRTAEFLNEISEALTGADKIILTDIYAARETNTFNISSKDIARLLADKYGKDVYYFSSFDEIETFLLENCSTGDVLITMGAGDVVVIGEKLLGI